MRFKKTIIISGIVLFLSVLITIADRVNIPPTTPEVKALAIRVTLSTGKTIPPNDFRFDGCTLFPEIILGSNLIEACLMHDVAYWSGGTPEEKRLADQAFKEAVAKSGTTGRLIAPLTHTGVAVFGDTWLTRIFGANWGFGWNN